MTVPAFATALCADGPANDRAGQMDLYSWLVGSWDLDVTRYKPEGESIKRKGEWHFAWVLEGRAIQDVWIVPPRGGREGDAADTRNSYGSTLRIYDPRIQAWRIQWTDPVTLNFLTMIGRKQGDDIVQIGTRPDGIVNRWRFTDINRDRFHWTGEFSYDEGETWQMEVEFDCRRVA